MAKVDALTFSSPVLSIPLFVKPIAKSTLVDALNIKMHHDGVQSTEKRAVNYADSQHLILLHIRNLGEDAREERSTGRRLQRKVIPQFILRD